MSDASKSDSAVPASTPAERVATPESTVVDTPAAAPVEPAPPVETAAPVVVAEPVVRKKRGVGAWSLVLGLLTGLGDIAFVIVAVATLAGAFAALSAGDFSAVGAVLGGAGLALLALFIFFGGFLTAGLGALLGLIALVSGRGRVLGLFGLLFSAGAIVVRVLLLSAGFSPDLG